jgi:hypothetical protein
MMPRMPSCHPLRRLAVTGTLLVLVGAAAAGPVSAATLTTDARCYMQGASLRMAAGGLTPRAPLVVALDGQALRYRDGSLPVADLAGAFESSFATPVLASGIPQQRHTLSIGDGRQQARARFTITRPAGAAFAPSQGDPRTLRARFSVWGFAIDSGNNARTWLHWVSPTGRVRTSAALGMTRGDCGALTTAPRSVFPFDPAPGRWLLAIDTQERYRMQTSGPRAKISVYIRSLSPRH